jgi:DnaK suppressor protein
MDKQKLDGYKKKLEKERGMLLAEIKQSESPKNFGADTEDPDEESDKSEEVGNQLAVAEDLKNRLGEIDVALSKVQNGKYGICEGCGKAIEVEILDIDPESRLCKTCKSKG